MEYMQLQGESPKQEDVAAASKTEQQVEPTAAPSSGEEGNDYHGKPRACQMSDVKTGQILEVFPSLSLAERATGISRSKIASACQQSLVVDGSYRFESVSPDKITSYTNLDSSGRELRKLVQKKTDTGSTSPASSESGGIALRRPKRAAASKKSMSSQDNTQSEEDEEDDGFELPEESPPQPPPLQGPRPASSRNVYVPHPLPSHLYGQPLVREPTDVSGECCSGCLGARDEQAEHEAILLCDGPGCNREYHLSCTHLSEIPDGNFYCEDCDAHGTTTQLRQYLEESALGRAKFGTSRTYVLSLLKKQLGDNGADVAKEKPRVPMSELWRLSELHGSAMSAAKSKSAARVEDEPPLETFPQLGPEFLVGKPLRMYSPVGNDYHDGRIIDWRKATHLSTVSEDKENDSAAFHGTSNIASSEFLVRFPAGANHRKQSLHCWIILEEHSLAVGVSLVWGKFDIRGGDGVGWKPAQTWLRTSLELVPVCHLLSEEKQQVSYDSTYRAGESDTYWALTKLCGDERHVLLNLKGEAIDFFSTEVPTRGARGSQHGSNRAPASPRKQGAQDSPPHDRQLEIATALAYAESQEQKRIQKWSCRMPLNNAAHKQAMTIVDESALAPIMLGTFDNEHRLAVKDDGIPRLCPVVDQGLDRLWLMQLMLKRGQDGVERSLDTAASLSCNLIECSPAAIAKVRDEQKA